MGLSDFTEMGDLGVTVAGRGAGSSPVPLPAGVLRLRARPRHPGRRELRGAGRRPAERALGAGWRAARAPQRQPVGGVPQSRRRCARGLDLALQRAVRALPDGADPQQPRRGPRERLHRERARAPEERGARRAAAARRRGVRRPGRLPPLHRRDRQPQERPQRQAHRRRAGAAAAVAAGAHLRLRGDLRLRDLLGRLHPAQGLLHRAVAPDRASRARAPVRRPARAAAGCDLAHDAASAVAAAPTASMATSSTTTTSSMRFGASPWRCSVWSTATSSSLGKPTG